MTRASSHALLLYIQMHNDDQRRRRKEKKNERRREIKSYEWRKGIEGQFSSRKATIQSNLCVFDREKERRKRKILK